MTTHEALEALAELQVLAERMTETGTGSTLLPDPIKIRDKLYAFAQEVADRLNAIRCATFQAEEPRGKGCHVCRCGGNGLCKCECHWKTADEVLAKLDEQVKANEEAIRADERRKIAEEPRGNGLREALARYAHDVWCRWAGTIMAKLAAMEALAIGGEGQTHFYYKDLAHDAVEKCAQEKARAERAEALLRDAREFVCHDPSCPLSQWSQGRPTEDGGYETMYAGKWYRGEDKPTCTCGLNALLERIEEVVK